MESSFSKQLQCCMILMRNSRLLTPLLKLKKDEVPRYFIKKVSRYRHSVPSIDGTSNGTNKVPQYFSTRYCSPLIRSWVSKLLHGVGQIFFANIFWPQSVGYSITVIKLFCSLKANVFPNYKNVFQNDDILLVSH